MRRILVILTGLSLVGMLAGCSSDDSDLTARQPTGEQTSRIVGGNTYDGLPAVGMLLYNGNPHCTGTVVDSRLVLTAGHCVSGFSASRMTFAIGPNAYSPQYTLRVASIEAHPNYNGSSITNDIGLVHLSQDSPVAPMGVVSSMDSSWVGKSLFFVGYGVDDGYNQSGAGVKRAVWMSISSVSSTTFRYDDPGRNTCNGDSGGPAFYQDANGNYLVAGVTSYGDQYCTQYGVDTRVDAYLDFVGIDGGGGGGGGDNPPQDPCNGETYEGRCDGDTVIWCENDQVHSQDCAGSSKVCGWSTANSYYGCLTPSEPDNPPDNPPDDPPDNPPDDPQDPCGGETYAGRCDGQTVVWCENEQVHTQDCASAGKQCAFDPDKQYYACIAEDTPPADPCNGETFEGRCENGSVIWCENDQVNSINCAQSGRTCAYNSAKGYYDCTY